MSLVKSVLAAIVMSVSLSACMSAKSFVDPAQQKVSYDDLKRRDVPLKLKLAVEFQRNGEAFPKADPVLRDQVERILRASGLIVPVAEAGEGEIKVTVNNIADRAGAAAKGFGTGLTFGLAGTTVMDAYEMSIEITVGDKKVGRTGIKHAIYTAIGNTSVPDNVEVFPINVAFGKVVEQMVVRSLRDMQKSGELSYRPWNLSWPQISNG